jgi:DNA polymerase-3 subunit epsilon
VSWCETETALEAALLEADEIKRLAPPFNVVLSAAGRAVWFATADLRDLRERPDTEHTIGPLVSPAPLEALLALRAVVAAGKLDGAPLVVRARAVGVAPPYAPGPESFAFGLERFVHEHGSVASTRALLRLGARLWERRRAATLLAAATDGAVAEEPRTAGRPVWDADRVSQALEETIVRAAHAVRRARWLVRLGECSLAWAEPGAERLRLLVISGGAVIARAPLEPGTPLPVPPGYARTAAERRTAIDVATFDRLRVLTTELRRIAAEAPTVELRLGPHARVSRRRLQAVLRWV